MKRFVIKDGLTLVSLIAFFVFLFMRIALLFSTDADIGGIENNVIYSICKVLKGGSLYEDPENGNFNISQYSPLYYYWVAGLSQALNLDPLENLRAIYVLGRLSSLFFNLISLFVIFKILRGIFQVPVAIVFPALSFAFLQFSRMHFATRPDAMAALLFLITVYFLLKNVVQEKSQKAKTKYVLIAMFFLVAGIFTKQSGIQLLFIPLFFLFRKDIGVFLLSSIGLAAFFLIGLLGFYFRFGGAFFQNTIGGLDNGGGIAQSYNVFSNYFSLFQMVLILSLFFLLRPKSEPNDSLLPFLRVLLAFSLLFALFSSSKSGSWLNYYNEFNLAAVLFISVEVHRRSSKNFQQSYIGCLSAPFLKFYLMLLLPNLAVHRYFHEYSNQFSFDVSVFEKSRRLAIYLRENLDEKRYFVSFDPYLNAMIPLQAAIPNKDLLPPVSKFDYSRFSSAVKKGEVKAWVFPKREIKASFMGVDLRGYKSEVFEGEFVVLINKKNGVKKTGKLSL